MVWPLRRCGCAAVVGFILTAAGHANLGAELRAQGGDEVGDDIAELVAGKTAPSQLKAGLRVMHFGVRESIGDEGCQKQVTIGKWAGNLPVIRKEGAGLRCKGMAGGEVPKHSEEPIAVAWRGEANLHKGGGTLIAVKLVFVRERHWALLAEDRPHGLASY